MPYIDKYQRNSLEDLIHMYRQYPYWKNDEENAKILDMIHTWLGIISKENPQKLDGYLNYMFTWIIKHTHRTFRLAEKKEHFCSFDKEAAYFIRQILFSELAKSESYSRYERLYGLLSLMEVEFERRGWSVGRPDIKAFFSSEKRYWRKVIVEYEDKKIQANGDVD